MTFEEIKELADAGDSNAMHLLGAKYAEGNGVEKDEKEAFKYFKKASETGHEYATSDLGFCYMYGLGTKQDYVEAYKAFTKAAIFGIGDAVVRLGDFFLNGYFVEKDEEAAYRLYLMGRRMCSHDLKELEDKKIFSDATRRIGDCFYYGKGINKDLSMAISCYQNALRVYEERKAMDDYYCETGLEYSRDMLEKAEAEFKSFISADEAVVTP